MFRFIHPFSDGTLSDIMIGARDLDHAFEQYRSEWWRQDMTGCVGIWHNAALTARIVPITNMQTDELEPLLQELKP